MSDSQAAAPGPPHRGRLGVPAGFEPIASALREDSAATGELVRARVAELGAGSAERPVTELLEELAATFRQVSGPSTDPPFALIRLLVGAWSDEALGRLPAATCHDPLTGLATMAHVRSKLAELYRTAERHGEGSAPDGRLVVIELETPAKHTPHLDSAMRMIDLGEYFRGVYDVDEVIGQLTDRRAVGVLPRAEDVQDGLAVLLGLLHDWRRRQGVSSRMWVETLPASLEAADALLDSLAQ